MSRAGSAASTDQALAAPVVCAIAPRQLPHAGSTESRGIGSHVQRSAPVRASNARTSPLAASVRLLSEIAEPDTSSPLIIAGGDVSSYSAFSKGALRSPLRSVIEPWSPKLSHGVPRLASSAMMRASIVPR